MSDVTDAKGGSRDRSPAFPAIPLSTAIDRLVTFEAHFKRSPARANRVGPAWGMKEKSSQADSTLAALRAYGLAEYKGGGEDREATLTEDGRTYLRAQQDSIKKEVLRRAALRPRNIEKYWRIWGSDRPAEGVCLDELILKDGFSDSGAPTFLKVYDATIAYAGLSETDKTEGGLPVSGLSNDEDQGDDYLPPPPPLPRVVKSRELMLMQDERELTTGLLSKGASFRLIVTGKVGEKEIERLIRKLELDKEILADLDTDHDAPDDEDRDPRD